MTSQIRFRSRPSRLPPFSFGFGEHGFKREIHRARRVEYIAFNTWTNALIDYDNARIEGNKEAAEKHLAYADAQRTKIIGEWIRRSR